MVTLFKGTTSSNGDNDHVIVDSDDASPNTRRTMSVTEFVESRFASFERLCNPISSAVPSFAKNSNTTKDVDTEGQTGTDDDTKNTTTASKAKTEANDDDENEDEDNDACTTITYLALLTSLYLPLVLFFWIKRSIMIHNMEHQLLQQQQNNNNEELIDIPTLSTTSTATPSISMINEAISSTTTSLYRSLFFGHILRLILAFFLLPPSTTKKIVPKCLWNFGKKCKSWMNHYWKQDYVQKCIPTWIHLVLAFVLGIENENIPLTIDLANILGSTTSSSSRNNSSANNNSSSQSENEDGDHNKRDKYRGSYNTSGSLSCLSSPSSSSSSNGNNSWPPPSLVALGIFTLVAIVIHPDGLTWIMLSQIR